MAAKHFQKPTEAELEILNILWNEGEQTVKYIHDKLSEKKEVRYTTTLKTMQNMNDKGMVERNTESKSHIYRAVIKESEAKRALLDKFLETTFGGSAMNLVLQALDNYDTSNTDREKIRQAIEAIERRKK